MLSQIRQADSDWDIRASFRVTGRNLIEIILVIARADSEACSGRILCHGQGFSKLQNCEAAQLSGQPPTKM